MVTIQALNGRPLQAEELPGNLFAVRTSRGLEIWGLPKILSIDGVRVTKDQRLGAVKKIYHYLLSRPQGNLESCIVRFVTTNPNDPKIISDYKTSLDDRRPVDDVFAVDTGGYEFKRLQKVLVDKGRDFTVMVIRNTDLVQVGDAQFKRWLNKSNFAYANAEYTHFFRVDGETGWGVSCLGISVKHAKKSAKRCQELFRQVEMCLMLKSVDDITMGMFDDGNVDGPETYYDGRTYGRRSLGVQMCQDIDNDERRVSLIRGINNGKIVELTYRYDGKFGVLKGTMTLVPDEQIPHDLETYHTNIKSELMTSGYGFMTAWEHKPKHIAIWNRQIEIELQAALTETMIKSDTVRLVTGVEAAVEAGTLPEWLLMGEDAHDDSGAPDVEQLSDTFNPVWQRWQMAKAVAVPGEEPVYNDVRAGQNLVYMAINGIKLRMDREEKVDGFHTKMWIPMTNAILVSVVTRESAERIGRFVFKDQAPGVCFYDDRIGFVMPGRRFHEGFRYHGGWDMDDQAIVLIVKVWASDPRHWEINPKKASRDQVLATHIGRTIPTLPNGMTYPDKEENAKLMVLVMRTPMGPGEWTLEVCDIDSLPIEDEFRNDDIAVIDISRMPLPADESERRVRFGGMPPDLTYSGKDMTMADSEAMIRAQMKNPGVGSFADPIMVYNTRRAGFPQGMLDSMEAMVDKVQQEADGPAFDAIALEGPRILRQIFGEEMDYAILATRVHDRLTRSQFKPFAGRYTKHQLEYVAAIERIDEKLIAQSMQMRAEQPLVQRIKAMKFTPALNDWAAQFFITYTNRLAAASQMYNAKKESNTFRKMIIQRQHKLAMEEIVQEMVDYFEGLPEQKRINRVIALWNYILKPHAKNPLNLKQSGHLGTQDRIIFQPNALGKKCVMDILIEALSTLK